MKANKLIIKYFISTFAFTFLSLPLFFYLLLLLRKENFGYILLIISPFLISSFFSVLLFVMLRKEVNNGFKFSKLKLFLVSLTFLLSFSVPLYLILYAIPGGLFLLPTLLIINPVVAWIVGIVSLVLLFVNFIIAKYFLDLDYYDLIFKAFLFIFIVLLILVILRGIRLELLYGEEAKGTIFDLLGFGNSRYVLIDF